MAESVPVRCPACRREHLYAAPSYPCVCGAPVTPPLDRLADPAPVTHRVWDEDWVTVRCEACGRDSQWPHPELGCSCGATLRIPVRRVRGVRGVRRPQRAELAPGTAADAHPDGNGESRARTAPDGLPRTTDDETHDTDGPPQDGDQDSGRDRERDLDRGRSRSAHAPSSAPRPAFQPVTIRTARDAVTAAALYLRWLGYRDIRRADQRPPSGIGLAARGILAQVDPTVRPASFRDVECLWLTAMTESAGCVYFSLAGYADDARARADTLGVPLFVLDLTGTPQPVNSPADELIATAG
ncbi:hypothetical protein [Streptomyces sp. R41]|uniref:Restriction endonuclease type IV Mrr domain-containing protein n=1 Tax=Streptomyces sp. R41 TaxID=3238632 RepID=A0AB39RWR1_9ACTN